MSAWWVELGVTKGKDDNTKTSASGIEKHCTMIYSL